MKQLDNIIKSNMYQKSHLYSPSLKNLNTFAIDVTAKKIIFVKTIQSLIVTVQHCKCTHTPYIILGEGSNILFLENYAGVVIINRIKGMKITDKNKFWLLHILSGEKWHDVVKYTLKCNIFGLENLALIPGCIGSAAIQNIGAYGLEFKDICLYVDMLCLKSYKIHRIDVNSCEFSYRSSIFKHKYNIDCFIIAVGIKLTKKWTPIIFPLLNVNYNTQIKNLTPYKIFSEICKIRTKNLPNPKKIGNAGSFFKNPIITKQQANKMLSLYNLPCYPQENGLIKISGGWLIQKYRFKNINIGDAAIHKKKKLILINKKNATANEIINLAIIIHNGIMRKFNIFLEPEVDFIGIKGKVHPSKIFKS